MPTGGGPEILITIVRSCINERFVMSAYRCNRTGNWRYRKWIKLPNGTRIRIKGSPNTNTKAAAESAEHAAIERAMHPERMPVLGGSLLPKKKEMPTISQFADRFMKEYLPRQKPTERYGKERIIATVIKPFFGSLALDEIDQSHVNAYVAAQTVATKTINNRLTVLSTMLRYAHELGLIGKPKVKCHIKSMSPEIIAVPASDLVKLINAAIDHRYKVAVLLASEAGLRIGEIRGLQHTDLKDGQLTVRRAIDQRNNLGSPKHDKRRSVPLSPALLAALAKLQRRGVWVLCTVDGEPLEYERMLDAINSLYLSAGVAVPVSESGVTMPWHSLRHSFGTELAAQGVPIPVIKELMGHSSIATTMRYVTVTASQLTAGIATAFGTERPPVGRTPANASKSDKLRIAETPGVTRGSVP